MPTVRIVALVLYCLSLLPGLIYGVVYLTRDRFMPYHRAALGRDWEQLDVPTRTLFLGLMKTIGGAMLGCTVAGAFLLARLFAFGESWANWALLAIGYCAGLPIVFVTFLVHRKTGANTPRLPAMAPLIMGSIAFLLSLAR